MFGGAAMTMLMEWGHVVGLLLNALGIIIAIIPPPSADDWRAETRKGRYYVSVLLISIGTALQM